MRATNGRPCKGLGECTQSAALLRESTGKTKAGVFKNSKLSFEHPADIGLGGKKPPFCRPKTEKVKTIGGKTDQDRIKNAGFPTGIFERLLKNIAFFNSLFVAPLYGLPGRLPPG